MTVLEEIIRLAANGRTLEFRATEQKFHITLRGDGVQATCQFPWRETVDQPELADVRLRHTLNTMYSDWKRERFRIGPKNS